MDYKTLIIQMLDKASRTQLYCLYHLIKVYLRLSIHDFSIVSATDSATSQEQLSLNGAAGICVSIFLVA